MESQQSHRFFRNLFYAFFVALPFVFSSSVMDPVLLPRWLFLLVVLMVGFGALLVIGKQDCQFPFQQHRFFWIAAAGFALLGLCSIAYATNGYEALTVSLKYSSELLFVVFIAVLVKNNLLTRSDFFKGVILLGLINGSIGLLQFMGADFMQALTKGDMAKGTLANPNLLASLLTLCFPFGIWGAKQGKTWKWLSLLMMAVAVISIALCETRTSYIALIIELALLWWVFLARSGSYGKWVWLAPLIVVIGLFSVVVLLLQLGELGHKDLFGSSTVQLRISLWENSWEMIKEHPIFGVGAGNWKIFFPKYSLIDTREAMQNGVASFVRPHNDYLWIAAELGIFGILFFLWLIFYPLYLVLKKIKEDRFLWGTACASLVGFAVTAAADFPLERISHGAVVFGTIGIAIATDPGPGNRKLPRWAVLLMILMAGSALFICFHRIQGEKYSIQQHRAYASQNVQQLLALSGKPGPEYYDLDPTVVPVDYFKGMAHATKNNFPKAARYFQGALKAHPWHLLSLNNGGIVFNQVGMHGKAVECFEKLKQVSPNYKMADYNRINSLLLNKQYEVSLQEFFKLPEEVQQEKQYQQLFENILRGHARNVLRRYPELKSNIKYLKALNNMDIMKQMTKGARKHDVPYKYWILPVVDKDSLQRAEEGK